MLKNNLRLIPVLILAVSLTGCAELQRKFVRKKKPVKETLSFYRPEEYQPKPAAERYQEHYVLWHNWHLDLARTEGTSYLRDMGALIESLRHLTAMRDLLEDEKADELDIQIRQLEDLKEKIKDGRQDITKDPHIRRTIERVERIIINNFTYTRMRGFIKKEASQENDKVESEEG